MTVAWERYDHVDCRDFGHAWQPQGVAVKQTRPLRYVRIFTCMRGCGTVRRDNITLSGDRSGNYKYNDDYRLERMTKADRRRLRLYNVQNPPQKQRRGWRAK